jgi:hypothetical protein
VTAIWPETLPAYFLIDGYGESEPDTVLRTPMETGPAKLRRRGTNAVRPVRGMIRISYAQRTTLSAFYQDTLAGGTLPFEWVHPTTREAATFRFVSKPAYTPAAGVKLNATLDLEILP